MSTNLIMTFNSQGFGSELRRLERFLRAACAKDRRYQELLPVIVPAGEEPLNAFKRL